MVYVQNKNNSSSHKANATTSSKFDNTKPKSDKSKSRTDKKHDVDHTANAVIKSGSSQSRLLQWATMASTTSKPIDDCTHSYSELSEWLIDSGCSNHMTPFEDDLISDVMKSKSVVEVANGKIVKGPNKGTALIRIVDVKTNKTFDMLLEDVLYVPGLSQRLFSVTQWTQSGG